MTSTVWIEKLKVSELKEELKKHGLPVSGKKVDLVERLRAHLESKVRHLVRILIPCF